MFISETSRFLPKISSQESWVKIDTDFIRQHEENLGFWGFRFTQESLGRNLAKNLAKNPCQTLVSKSPFLPKILAKVLAKNGAVPFYLRIGG